MICTLGATNKHAKRFAVFAVNNLLADMVPEALEEDPFPSRRSGEWRRTIHRQSFGFDLTDRGYGCQNRLVRYDSGHLLPGKIVEPAPKRANATEPAHNVLDAAAILFNAGLQPLFCWAV